jgi:hypothetical protein
LYAHKTERDPHEEIAPDRADKERLLQFRQRTSLWIKAVFRQIVAKPAVMAAAIAASRLSHPFQSGLVNPGAISCKTK